MTPQDRPRVPTTYEIYDLVREGLERHQECNCYESCVDPDAAVISIGSMTSVVDTNWAYRWSFTFASTDADYYAFMAAESPIVLEWDGVSSWVSADVAGPCPGGAGGETPLYRWELEFSSASVQPGVFTLTLKRNGGTGTCDEWTDLVYTNVHPFDPLCGNLLRPRDRGLVAPYSDGLSCLICLEPVQTLVEITCLGEAMTVPESLGVVIPAMTGDAAHSDCCDPAALLSGSAAIFTHDAGCVWAWSGGESCDQGTYTVDWAGEIEIVDAGGGDVKVQLTLTLTATGSISQTDTYTWLSAAIAIEDVADALQAALPLPQDTTPGGTPLCDWVDPDADDELTLFPV